MLKQGLHEVAEMIMTYDFLIYAKNDEKFMQQIRECIVKKTDSELHTEIHKLHFNSKEQAVEIEPLSDTSKFREKIVPKVIKYNALMKMLDGHWDEMD